MTNFTEKLTQQLGLVLPEPDSADWSASYYQNAHLTDWIELSRAAGHRVETASWDGSQLTGVRVRFRNADGSTTAVSFPDTSISIPASGRHVAYADRDTTTLLVRALAEYAEMSNDADEVPLLHLGHHNDTGTTSASFARPLWDYLWQQPVVQDDGTVLLDPDTALIDHVTLGSGSEFPNGHVIKMVSATSGYVSASSAVWIDIISAQITPGPGTKVLLLGSTGVGTNYGNNYAAVRLLRDSTILNQGTASGLAINGPTSIASMTWNNQVPMDYKVVDSAHGGDGETLITYKMQLQLLSGTGMVYAGRSYANNYSYTSTNMNTLILLEVK